METLHYHGLVYRSNAFYNYNITYNYKMEKLIRQNALSVSVWKKLVKYIKK